MKRGQIHNLLIVLLISFVLILVGSIFNIFTITGNMSKCPKVPLSDLFRCPEGFSIVPNYNTNNCIYAYQCAEINCPNVNVPDCGYRKAPVPIFGWYSGNRCVFDYECIEKEEDNCNTIIKPSWKCSEGEMVPVFDDNGCIINYQCEAVFPSYA